MKLKLLFSTLLLLHFNIKAQTENSLKSQLESIINQKKLTAAISVKNLENGEHCDINGNMMMPMMSVFKFHIALAVLDLVDKGKLKLDQQFLIQKKDLKPDTWSPMRDDYPNGNVSLSLDKLLRYTVSHSDNNGCDILLDIIGGTSKVQNYINQIGIRDFVIKVNEAQMNWDNQYQNVTTANATTLLLEKFYKGKLLKKKTNDYLYQIMVETSRGLTWMKAGLPKNTILAHRTGISNTNNDGLRAAMNDVGIFQLPNGKHVIISVYLKNIKENREDTEATIAKLTSTTYNFYNK